MDPFEKLLQQETDTDEKFAAAADFFTELKTAGVKVRHNAQNKQQSKKVRSESRDKIRQLLASQKATSVKLPVQKAPASAKAVKPVSLSGQARTPVRAPSKSKGYKEVSVKDQKVPDKKIAVLPALKKKVKTSSVTKSDQAAILTNALLEKQAFYPFSAAARAAKGAVGAGTKAHAVGSAAAEGAKLGLKPQASRWSQIGEALKGAGSKIVPQPVKDVGGAIARKYRSGATKWQNFWDPGLAGARKQGQGYIDDFIAQQGSRAAAAKKSPEALKAWDDAMAVAEGKRNTLVKAFEKSRSMNRTTGLGSTASEIMTAVKGADGKISPSSIYKGLENLGLTSPEQLLGMGMGAAGAIKATRASRAAAKAHNRNMLIGGGAAGLGALALLKGRKNSGDAQVVIR